MRRDKPQIDQRAHSLIAQFDTQERKQKFCDDIKRDAENPPKE